MLIITTNKSPDLDGIACVIAYSELKKTMRVPHQAFYAGNINLETEFVSNFTKTFPFAKHEGNYEPDSQFIIVDGSYALALEKTIPLNLVIEVWDHHLPAFLEDFPNSVLNHVEKIGACATLIAEEFQTKSITPSASTATYLYSAIVSNTINFKNQLTTGRDIQAAQWLEKFAELPEDYVYQMFKSKSVISKANLEKILTEDFVLQEINGKRIGITQLEIVDLRKFFEEHKAEFIKVLTKLKAANHLDLLLFNGIDIFAAKNLYFVIDAESDLFFSKLLNGNDLRSGFSSETIMMRKQIWGLANVA
ncbi:MAG: DHHA2 domain-containing protein [bacterium]